MTHPLDKFRFCPVCSSNRFGINNEKSKKCANCGFVYYFNPSAAVACFVTDGENILVAVRANDPAKGTYDLPGGFVDNYEDAEQSVIREVKEETGLDIKECRYLFSLPNIYPFSGFEVHTLDIVFECLVENFEGIMPADDVAELKVIPIRHLCSNDFGLTSIKEAVGRYQQVKC